MTRRRCLYFGFLIALGWGLYLFVPPSPRWTLPANELPLKSNDSRMLTLVLDSQQRGELWEEFLESNNKDRFATNYFVGSGNCVLWVAVPHTLHVRDLETGKILGSVRTPHGKTRVLRCATTDFRRVIFFDDKDSIEVHDFDAATHWTLENVRQAYFSPIGTMIQVWSDEKDQLLDSSNGRVIAEYPRDYGNHSQFAADDSLFIDTNGIDEWLLWERSSGKITKGKFPAAVAQLHLAPDGRMAAVWFRNPDKLVLWDVRRREIVRELNTSLVPFTLILEFTQDSGAIIAWMEPANDLPIEGAPIERFDATNGQRTVLSMRQVNSTFAFSPDRRKVMYSEGIDGIARSLVDGSELWRFSWPIESRDEIGPGGLAGPGGLDQVFGRTFHWTWTNSNFIVGERIAARPGQWETDADDVLVLDSGTGREILRRHKAICSLDRQLVITEQKVSAAQAHGLPEPVIRWLPWLRDKVFVRWQIERSTDGRQLFQMARIESELGAPLVRLPCTDAKTLVIVTPGQGTEIWDLPPPRRWVWILVPPVTLAGVPWAWRLMRRKLMVRATPSGQKST